MVHAGCHVGPFHFVSKTHCLQRSSRPRRPRLAGGLTRLPSVGRHWRLSAFSSQRNRFVEGRASSPAGGCEALERFLFLPVYSEYNNQLVWGYPPPPLSIGIIGLGGKSRKIFEFKGLIRKIFRNKDLACQRALKMVLGQLRGPSWETNTLKHCPNQMAIVAPDRWGSL